MPRFFFNQYGVYVEAMTDIATPQGWTETTKQSPSVTITADDVRLEAARRLRALAALGNYTDEERETWAEQLHEARLLELDSLLVSGTPLIDAMAARRGITRLDMRDRIIANANIYKPAAGVILGCQAVLLEMDPIPQDYATNESYWD